MPPAGIRDVLLWRLAQQVQHTHRARSPERGTTCGFCLVPTQWPCTPWRWAARAAHLAAGTHSAVLGAYRPASVTTQETGWR